MKTGVRKDIRVRIPAPPLPTPFSPCGCFSQLRCKKSLAASQRRVSDELLQDVISLYDGEIAYFDAAFGAFIGRLEERGLLDETLIVFVADHGEEFLDHHSWSHGMSLYREQLHVPLYFRFPDRWGAGTTPGGRAQQIDIVPTILAYLGIPLPEDVDGINLFAEPTLGEGPRDAVPAVAQLNMDSRHIRSIIFDGMKLIDYVSDENSRGRAPGVELFDMREDPKEQRDLAAARPEVVARLRGLLEVHLSQSPEPFTPERAFISAELERQLRALGYIQDE